LLPLANKTPPTIVSKPAPKTPQKIEFELYFYSFIVGKGFILFAYFNERRVFFIPYKSVF
jgi:hypothetical protein